MWKKLSCLKFRKNFILEVIYFFTSIYDIYDVYSYIYTQVFMYTCMYIEFYNREKITMDIGYYQFKGVSVCIGNAFL